MNILCTLDPQLGRWWQIDPEVETFMDLTPYNQNLNNPILYSDPNGDCPTCPGGDDVYAKGAIVQNKQGAWQYLGEGKWKDLSSNPSVNTTNNKTGYYYDKSDQRVRNALLSLGSGNIITATVLKSEKEGNFQPLTAHNYLKQVDERSARMMMFVATAWPAAPSVSSPSIKPFNYQKQYNHVTSRLNLRGLTLADIEEAKTNYLWKSEIKYDNLGRPSYQVVGEKITVAINPQTGKHITAWRTGTKERNKYMKLKSQNNNSTNNSTNGN